MNTDKNTKVLKFLEKKEFSLFLSPDELSVDPYFDLGSHPEIVERLWDQINPRLPADCRRIIYGTPALMNFKTGLILAIAIGTMYALRIPLSLKDSVLATGAETLVKWSDGSEMDTSVKLGEDWIFGSWSALEIGWITQCYLD